MKIVFLLLIILFLAGCNSQQQKVESMKNNYAKGSFGYDLAFLQKHDSVIVLKSGEAQVIVSAKYQAKVFTSTAEGPDGNSFGWIHYPAFEGPLDQHMNAYGGENRFWLGPEGGKFSLFFSKGSKMEFANWKTPAAIDSEPWTLEEKSDHKVSLKKEMQAMKAGQELLHKKLADEKKELTDRIERDRAARERKKKANKQEVCNWAARIGAGAVAATAVVFTAGAAAPAAILFMGGVEAMIEEQ